VQLTVVGCSPAWPNPGVAHSGYLVEGPGRLLLDCGAGVLATLRELDGAWPRIDTIAITHWHLDHWGDLVPWVWGGMFGPGREVEQPELAVPPGGAARLAEFGGQLGSPSMFEETFRVSEYAPGEELETAAGLRLTPLRVPHYRLETYAFRVTNGKRTLAYSGDSGPSNALAEAARDADLFVCEATLADAAAEGELRGHLSADEAVGIFRDSGAKRLLLTHRPDELALDSGLERASVGLAISL
jgi:ribonuclease BN (tRNA processing enzyme)